VPRCAILLNTHINNVISKKRLLAKHGQTDYTKCRTGNVRKPSSYTWIFKDRGVFRLQSRSRW